MNRIRINDHDPMLHIFVVDAIKYKIIKILQKWTKGSNAHLQGQIF